MLKTFFTITQDILAHITQVNIQITSLKGWIWISQERIHQPKLHIFYVRLFEVCIVQFTHNTAPTLSWIG